MRTVGIAVFVATMSLAVALFFGPRIPYDDTVRIAADQIRANPDAYVARRIAAESGVRPGAEMEIVWAAPETKSATPISIVYLHGFSATKQEVRPLPDEVAAALGANVFFARLTGHGQDGAALAEATAHDWINDTAEALEIGAALGERVLVIAASTGGTLAALAARHPDLADKIDGVVFLSPNFGVQAAGAGLLTAPFAEAVIPRVFGERREWTPANAEHGRWWTTSYPTQAVFPMAAVVKAARAAHFDEVGIPALFLFSDDDQVVDAAATRSIAARWGGEAQVEAVKLGPEDDPARHVIAGRILSPGMTGPLTDRIVAWARAELIGSTTAGAEMARTGTNG